MNIQHYNKAIVALTVGLLVVLLKQFNFPVDQAFQDALGIVVTGFLVYLVPNKK